MNPLDIKLGLASLFKDIVHVGCGVDIDGNIKEFDFRWQNKTNTCSCMVVETEWDYICHLLESQMTPEELDTYYYDFLHVKDEDHAYAAIANWEKRGPAILRFRGIVK